MSARRWAAGVSLLGLMAAAWPSGCKQEVGLGTGLRPVADDGSGGGGPVTFGAACVACGDFCVLPGDFPGLCDASLDCVSTTVTCAAPGCEGNACGLPCDPCFGDPQCEAEPSFCQADGTCIGVAPDCPSPACAGQLCGTFCDPCPAGDSTCTTPIDLFVCDAGSACRPAIEVKCEPCIALAQEKLKCGETCNPCAPWDSGCKTDGMFVCGADGSCLPPDQLAQCSPSYEPCGPDAACGQPCTVCDPYDVANCAVTPDLFCTGPNGSCTDKPVLCEETPCGGPVPCGAQCGFCWPWDVACEQRFCDGNDDCMPAPLDVDCPGADPCDGTPCGEACYLCDPILPGCGAQNLFLVCSVDGCGDVPYICGGDYAPCVGKACGELCDDYCDPYDPGCVPSGYKTCDAGGSCVENAPPCF